MKKRLDFLSTLMTLYIRQFTLFIREKNIIMYTDSVSMDKLFTTWAALAAIATEYNCNKYWWQRRLTIPRFYLTSPMLFVLSKVDPEWISNEKIREAFPMGRSDG